MRVFAISIGWAVIVAAALSSYYWVGYIASDDLNYAQAALWLRSADFFEIRSSGLDFHSWLRFPVTLPIMGSFALFGTNVYSLALPTTLYYIGILSLVFVFMYRMTSLWFALLSVLLIGSTPLLWERSSSASADIAECFYIIAAFMVLFLALRRKEENLYFAVFSGVLLGLGYLVRETTAPYCIVIFLLFIFNCRSGRRAYFMVGVGFLIVLAIDTAFFYEATGEPFLRFISSSGAIEHTFETAPSWDIRSHGGESQRAAWYHKDSLIPYTGDYLSPFVMLFTNKEAVLVTLLGIASGLSMLLTRSRLSFECSFLYFCALGGFIFFTLLPDQLSLRPRYISPAVVAIALASLVQVHTLWTRGYRKLCLSAVLVFFLGNFTIISLANPYPIYGVTTFASVIKKRGETVYTDPETFRLSMFLLMQDKLTEKAGNGLPPSSGLFLRNPNQLKRPNKSIGPDDLKLYKVQPNWKVVSTYLPPKKPVARLLDMLNLSDHLPRYLYKKIYAPVSPVTLYRVS